MVVTNSERRHMTVDEIDFIVKDLRTTMTLIAGSIATMVNRKEQLNRRERVREILWGGKNEVSKMR
jgi:hypothetical protein